ncbi:MAG: hypothetical protein Q8891_13865 [Bacteroidota bacterium]|nr:hypothetical protein [Bacteroidota bacterium]
MVSLFNVKINWGIYFGILVLILLIIPGISIWSFLALMIAVHQFMLVFYSYGYVIPVRYWCGAMMSLQMLVGPSFAYNGLDKYQFIKYRMQVPEYDYFSYAIPAVILFILGLHISAGKLKGEKINEPAVKEFVQNNPDIPYVFIAIGFFSSMVSGFFGSELANVFYLLGSFKFIGAFMLLLGGRTLKVLPLVIVFGSIVLSSLSSAMFHDLVTWAVFFLAVITIKYKPPITTKGLFALGFFVLIIIIQQLKNTYREATQFQGKQGNIEAFDDAYDEARTNGTIFDMNSLAQSNVRINQGFIVTYVMTNIPAREPFADGAELYKILEAAFLPRIIAPNKLKAGDNTFFTKYSGIQLRRYTSMSLSAMGDGYANFGIFGGCIFMFVLGWIFNLVLNGFQKFSRNFPVILLFTPMVFYFPMRPDTALQTGLGHLVKSCFLLYMMLIFWKKDLNKGAVSEKVLRSKQSLKKARLEGA